jgi:hypothetical protein
MRWKMRSDAVPEGTVNVPVKVFQTPALEAREPSLMYEFAPLVLVYSITTCVAAVDRY